MRAVSCQVLRRFLAANKLPRLQARPAGCKKCCAIARDRSPSKHKCICIWIYIMHIENFTLLPHRASGARRAWTSRCRRAESQSAGTLDLYSMQIRASAFKGESVSVTDLLADSLALTGSATLDGLTAQGDVGCDQLLRNDVNCTDVFTTGVDASGAVSCAALTATGTVAGATTQHGLLDGADDALREVGVAPGHLLLDVPEIGGARKTVLQRLRGHFLGQRIDGHQHEGVWLAPEGLHVGLQLVHGLQRHEAVVASLRPVLIHPEAIQKRLHLLSGRALGLVDGLDGSPAGVGHVSYGFFGPRWACQASTLSSRAWKPLHTPQTRARW